jgi:hypothetical protein
MSDSLANEGGRQLLVARLLEISPLNKTILFTFYSLSSLRFNLVSLIG